VAVGVLGVFSGYWFVSNQSKMQPTIIATSEIDKITVYASLRGGASATPRPRLRTVAMRMILFLHRH
jgi:hypothetical protein